MACGSIVKVVASPLLGKEVTGAKDTLRRFVSKFGGRFNYVGADGCFTLKLLLNLRCRVRKSAKVFFCSASEGYCLDPWVFFFFRILLAFISHVVFVLLFYILIFKGFYDDHFAKEFRRMSRGRAKDTRRISCRVQLDADGNGRGCGKEVNGWTTVCSSVGRKKKGLKKGQCIVEKGERKVCHTTCSSSHVFRFQFQGSFRLRVAWRLEVFWC